MNLLGNLFGLATDPARKAYEAILTTLAVFVGVVLIGLSANLLGVPEVNMVLAFGFALGTTIVWWRPVQAGIAMTAISPIKGTALDQYRLIWEMVTLTGMLIFFYLSIIPFRQNPYGFFTIITVVPMILLMDRQFNLSGGLGKRIVFYSAVMVLVYAVVSTILPVEFWGDSQSFVGRGLEAIKAKPGGPLGLMLFITVILAVMDKRASAKNLYQATGGYTIMALILVALMVLAFMPKGFGGVSIAMPQKAAMSTAPSHQASVTNVSKKQSRNYLVAKIDAPVEGFAWTPRVPDYSQIEKFNCPKGVVMVVEHRGTPEGGVLYDCDEGKPIRLANDMLDLYFGFHSKGPGPVRVEITLRTAT